MAMPIKSSVARSARCMRCLLCRWTGLDIVEGRDRVGLGAQAHFARLIAVVGDVNDLLTVEEAAERIAADFDLELLPLIGRNLDRGVLEAASSSARVFIEVH